MKEFVITTGFSTDSKDAIGRIELTQAVVDLIEATYPMGNVLAPSILMKDGKAEIQSFSFVCPSQAMTPEVKP